MGAADGASTFIMFRFLLYIAVFTAAVLAREESERPIPHLIGEADASSYIVGGDFVTEKGKWQSMCSIQLGTWHYCGASLISDSWVVTAAHCLVDFNAKEMNVVCGVLDHWDHSIGSMEVHEIDHWTTHSDYEGDFSKGFPNDVAVIKLKWPINQYNPYVKPVTLAENDGYVWQGSECYAVGWGKTGNNQNASNKLKQAKLDIITSQECYYYWGDSVNYNHICAKDMSTHDKGACNGDSGGPLYCTREDKLYQVGIFNWMSGNCHTFWPSMYSSVALYRD